MRFVGHQNETESPICQPSRPAHDVLRFCSMSLRVVLLPWGRQDVCPSFRWPMVGDGMVFPAGKARVSEMSKFGFKAIRLAIKAQFM